MVTYLYWLIVIALVCGALFGIGMRLGQWKPALILAAVIALVGTTAYYFWLQQIFVKRYGGVMSITIPQGLQHIGSTWKGDNLWIEDYNPETNECIFREYSRGDLLQGRVVLKNCHPLGARSTAPAATTAE
ncbi:MAG: hypothetical protein R3175_05210 [Marinobacter sp.]|uniref:hypothetical protein n=1 Tax=Marinobacter sp. TaxID=50741 RepID=UPI00299DCC2E|nr:hypothetical protein [Marinobacter sp.]MDX1755442.1 hypothetical protein [Marinobacter sp.]